MAGGKEFLLSEKMTEDLKLSFLKEEAQELEKAIDPERVHGMDIVIRVSSIALQFGQLGKVWDGFVSEKEARDRTRIYYTETGRRFYPLIGPNLGEMLHQELEINISSAFSTDSLKRIATLSNMMGLWMGQMERFREIDKGLREIDKGELSDRK